MKKNKIPMTPALRVLKQAKIDYTVHTYDYVEKGGTASSSLALGFDEHVVIKTLIMQDEAKKPLVILMHGDKQVSLKNLARQIGVKSVTPCDPQVAQKHSGYKTGGTSPFGTRKALPVYCEESIISLDKIVINGGGQGLLVEVSSQSLAAVLDLKLVNVAI